MPVQFFYDDAPVLEERGALQPGFAEAPPTDSYVFEFLNTREGLELNRAFAKITDPATRRAVIDLVRALAKEDPPGQPLAATT